jgi:hypothetical protein
MIKRLLSLLLAIGLAASPAAATLRVNQLSSFGVYKQTGAYVCETAAITYQTTAANTGASTGSVYTFAAQAIGTAAADRYVVLGFTLIDSASSFTIASVSIGGVAATKIITQNEGDTVATNANIVSGFYYANVPTGTTADVVITASEGIANSGSIGVWTVTGLTSAAFYGLGFPYLAANANQDRSNAIAVPKNGATISYYTNTAAALRTVTFTNTTEDFDGAQEGTTGK